MTKAFVFIAGIDGTVDLFQPFAERLRTQGYQVLLYSHEHLVSRASCSSLDVFVEEVRQLLKAHGVERAIICGESFGGPIAQTFVRRYPEHTEALVLLASFAYLPFRWRARVARTFGAALSETARFVPNLVIAIARRIYNPSGGHWEPPELLEKLRTKRTAGLQAYIVKSCLALDFDSRGWLPEIRVPTLVLTGARDRLISPGCSREISSLIPGARLEMIPDSGHLSHYAYPEKFWSILTTFLANLPLEAEKLDVVT